MNRSSNTYVPHNLPIATEGSSDDLSAVKLPHIFVRDCRDYAPSAFSVAPKSLGFIDFLWEHKIRLAGTIFGVFFVVYTLFAALGLLPQSLAPEPDNAMAAYTVSATSTDSVATSTPVALSSIEAKIASASSTEETTEKKPVVKSTQTATTATKKPVTSPQTLPVQAGEDPVRVVISRIGVDTRVTNPHSINPVVLDEYLKKGAVRYAESKGLGAGNTLIFAHSTNHPVVINQAYKAFNNFSQIVPGDTVLVYSIDRVYVYKVENLRLAMADEVYVDLGTSANMLTLSTCNTFGEKEERFVVSASLVSSQLITERPI